MNRTDFSHEDSFITANLSQHRSQLEEKVRSRQASVGVIGLGYVGLPLCVHAAESGFPVMGFDVDPRKISSLRAGRSYISDVADSRLEDLMAKGIFNPGSNPSLLDEADIIIISVPTPLTQSQTPDMSYIREATRLVRECLKPGMLVILESTTYPGCTREELLPVLEQGGLSAGSDFWLAFSPERVNPGSGYSLSRTPKLVGGVTADCTGMASLFYGQFIETIVSLSSPEAAEMAKLLENVYRSVNIALVNELAMICNAMDINVWEVVDAAATKPFGFTPFYPGPGMGGHCIPIDPFYLSYKARELGMSTEFIELAGKINTRMPHYVVERVITVLNERSQCLKGASVMLLGAAYKADVSDLRESPAIKIVELLMENGARVSYHDPHVPAFSVGEQLFRSMPLDGAALAAADCVVVLTPHSAIDWAAVGRDARLVVDTRNIVPVSGGKVYSI